jgi:hypothetical protein
MGHLTFEDGAMIFEPRVISARPIQLESESDSPLEQSLQKSKQNYLTEETKLKQYETKFKQEIKNKRRKINEMNAIQQVKKRKRIKTQVKNEKSSNEPELPKTEVIKSLLPKGKKKRIFENVQLLDESILNFRQNRVKKHHTKKVVF